MDAEFSIDWNGIIVQALPYILGAATLLIKRVRATLVRIWRQISGANAMTKEDLEAFRAGLEKVVRDWVDTLKTSVETVAINLETLSQKVEVTQSMFRNAADRDEMVAFVECDEDLGFTWVARAMTDWLDSDRNDILARKWMNCVKPEHRPLVRDELLNAKVEHRDARVTFEMAAPASKGHAVEWHAYTLHLTPHPENKPVRRWLGSIRRVA